MEWNYIKTAPKQHRKRILLYKEHYKNPIFEVGYWEKGSGKERGKWVVGALCSQSDYIDGYYCPHNTVELKKPTHWRELPEPPKK